MMITMAKSWPIFPNAARRASVAHVTMRVVSIKSSHKTPKCGASIPNPAIATKRITPVSNGAATTATDSLASSVWRRDMGRGIRIFHRGPMSVVA